MNILTKEEANHIHTMYELRTEEPRIKIYEIAQHLDVVRNTVYKRQKKAVENAILFNPELRLKMYEDVKEYVYAISSDSAFHTFHQLQGDDRLCYEVFATGYFDLLLITSVPLSRKELECLGKVRLTGYRSNYVIPKIPDIDYVTAIAKMEEFAKKDFEPSEWSVEYPPREMGWKEIDWKLFHLLRHNMAKKYTELAKSVEMSYDGFRWSLKRILANTQIIVPYYPEGYSQYTRFLFMFQSDYEQMLLDMFSLVPCFTMMYKVKNWLLVHFRILPSGLSYRFFRLIERFFSILYDLHERGYIDRIKTTIPITYWHPD